MKGQSCKECQHYLVDNEPRTRCFAWGFITETGETCELGELLIENKSLKADNQRLRNLLGEWNDE